jgi:hypothetical protein
MGNAAVRSTLRRIMCRADPSALVAVGWGSNIPAKVNRYGPSMCESVKREMERRSSGSGVGKHGACGGVFGESSVLINSGTKAKRNQTRREVAGTMV